MSTSAGKSGRPARVSGQKIISDLSKIGLTPDLQNSPDADILLDEMSDAERELFFDRLIQLVLHDGTEQ